MTIIILQLHKNGNVTRIQMNELGEVVAEKNYMHLADLPPIKKDAKIIVTLPGEDVLVTQTKIPKASHRELMKAIPFALEEQLAADINGLYFAPGSFDAMGQLAVAVIDKAKFEHCVNRLKQFSVKANALLPDYLAITYEKNHWTVYLQEQRALVRTGEQSGFSTDIETLPLLLQLALERSINLPQKIKILGCADHVDRRVFDNLEKNVTLEFVTEGRKWASAEFISQPAINLLQGKYRVKNKRTKSKKYWKITGITVAAWVAVLFGTQLVQLVYFNIQTNRLQRNIASLYHRVFPDVSDVVEPRARVKRELDNLMTSSRPSYFIKLLNQVSEVLQQNPAVNLKSIEYQNRALTLQVLSNKLANLENFTHTLIKRGLEVTQKQLAPSNKKVTAEIVIKGPIK